MAFQFLHTIFVSLVYGKQLIPPGLYNSLHYIIYIYIYICIYIIHILPTKDCVSISVRIFSILFVTQIITIWLEQKSVFQSVRLLLIVNNGFPVSSFHLIFISWFWKTIGTTTNNQILIFPWHYVYQQQRIVLVVFLFPLVMPNNNDWFGPEIVFPRVVTNLTINFVTKWFNTADLIHSIKFYLTSQQQRIASVEFSF